MDKKSVWYALILSFVRVVLATIGGALLRKGIIDQGLLDRLLSEGSAQIVGVLITFVVLGWSFRDKIINAIRHYFALEALPGTPPELIDSQVARLGWRAKLSLLFRE